MDVRFCGIQGFFGGLEIVSLFETNVLYYSFKLSFMGGEASVVEPDDTKKRILEAAGEVFAEKGFEATTVREIVAKAKANVAAVNYHFGDKHRLYVEAVQAAYCSQDVAEDMSWPIGTEPEEKLRAYIGTMMASMWDHDRPAWQTEIVFREMDRPSAACVELVRNFIGPKFARLCQILREFIPHADQRELHLHAFSIVGQCLLYRFHRPVGRLLAGDQEYNSYSADQLAHHIWQFSLAGLVGERKPSLSTETSERDEP